VLRAEAKEGVRAGKGEEGESECSQVPLDEFGAEETKDERRFSKWPLASTNSGED
jgi:hypothetical protein